MKTQIVFWIAVAAAWLALAVLFAASMESRQPAAPAPRLRPAAVVAV